MWENRKYLSSPLNKRIFTFFWLTLIIPLACWLKFSFFECPEPQLCTFTSNNATGGTWCAISSLNSSTACEIATYCPKNKTSPCWVIPNSNNLDLCPVMGCTEFTFQSSIVIIFISFWFIIALLLIIDYIREQYKSTNTEKQKLITII